MLSSAVSGMGIKAKVPYLRSDMDCLHVEFTARILGEELLDKRSEIIRNGRAQGQQPTLEREGFQIVSHTCPVVENRLDELMTDMAPIKGSPSQRAYWDETIPVIRELSGARDVLPVFASTIRYSPVLRNSKAMTPAGWPHVDYDTGEAEIQLKETLELNGFDPAPFSRYVLYQGWRTLTPPPQDFPLAMCDGRTVTPDDIVPIEYHMKTDEREVTYQSSGARFSPRHEWWYFPDMTPDEMLVFKGFDSALGESFKTLHVAIEDTTHDKPVPRVSIESRYFALFD